MNDPHVVSLWYRVKTAETVSYNKPPAVTVNDSAYDMTLMDDVLTVTMKEHHPTVGSAMARVKGHLRAWELQTALDMGHGHLEFEFDNAEVVDRNPPPTGTQSVHLVTMSGSGSIQRNGQCTPHESNVPRSPIEFRCLTHGRAPLESVPYVS